MAVSTPDGVLFYYSSSDKNSFQLIALKGSSRFSSSINVRLFLLIPHSPSSLHSISYSLRKSIIASKSSSVTPL